MSLRPEYECAPGEPRIRATEAREAALEAQGEEESRQHLAHDPGRECGGRRYQANRPEGAVHAYIDNGREDSDCVERPKPIVGEDEQHEVVLEDEERYRREREPQEAFVRVSPD